MTNWREHQLYGRYDIPVGGSTRVLLNPGLFLHEGRAPNGTIPGRFLGFVQGVGLQLEGEDVSWTPAVAVIAGRAQLNSGGARPPNGSLQLTGGGVSVQRVRREVVDGAVATPTYPDWLSIFENGAETTFEDVIPARFHFGATTAALPPRLQVPQSPEAP